LNGFEVERRVFVHSQLMSILIRVNPGVNWQLVGKPADFPEAGEEEVDTQLDLLRIYEQYGLYQPNIIDTVMGGVETLIGKMINLNRQRTEWSDEGVFDENGKAVSKGRETPPQE
jgi:hypothetical protein